MKAELWVSTLLIGSPDESPDESTDDSFRLPDRWTWISKKGWEGGASDEGKAGNR